jgi:predicted TIM-barrel enzyme
MAKAGVDMIVPHIGLTSGGTTGSKKAMSLDEAVKANHLSLIPKLLAVASTSACFLFLQVGAFSLESV